MSLHLEFEPHSWCREFSEYKDFDELRDNTTVIEFDGGIIVQDF